VGWELRRGRQVYYRSVRDGQKVRHVYVGFGPAAVAAAAEDERRRAKQEVDRADRERRCREWSEAFRPLQDLADVTDALLDATLLATGYDRHDRGRWRKRRKPMPATASNPPQPPPRTDGDAVLKRLVELSELAQRGDGGALAELGEILDVNPKFSRKYGDLTRPIRLAWAKRAAGNDPLGSECLLRSVEEIEKNLCRPDASQLERLLVRRVGAAYLAVQVADIEAAGAANATGKGVELLRRDTLARLATSERMYQAALKALSIHQTLTRPRPSPADLLRPVDEKAPASNCSTLESRRSMAGVGVG
jgi:hypothetical protein